MTFDTLYRIALVGATIYQLIIVIIAEDSKEYAKASYEMLWLFLLLYFCHKEFKE